MKETDVFEQIKRLPTTDASNRQITQLAPDALAYLERTGWNQADVLDALGLGAA